MDNNSALRQEVIFTENTALASESVRKTQKKLEDSQPNRLALHVQFFLFRPDREIWDEKGGLIKKGPIPRYPKCHLAIGVSAAANSSEQQVLQTSQRAKNWSLQVQLKLLSAIRIMCLKSRHTPHAVCFLGCWSQRFMCPVIYAFNTWHVDTCCRMEPCICRFWPH